MPSPSPSTTVASVSASPSISSSSSDLMRLRLQATSLLQEEKKDTDTATAVRERRAMLDLELRLLHGSAKSQHEAHSLHTRPHYSRTLQIHQHTQEEEEEENTKDSQQQHQLQTDKPITSLPLLTQLDTEETIRRKVSTRLHEITSVATPPKLHFALDTYLEECEKIGTLKNDSWSVFCQLLTSLESRLHESHCLNYMLLSRFTHIANLVPPQVYERLTPRFSYILGTLHKQYERMKGRYEVLKKTYEENNFESTTAASSSFKPSTSFSTPTTSRMKRSGWERSMTRSDLEDYIRTAIPHSQLYSHAHRYLLKLRWLHISHANDIMDYTTPDGIWSSTKDLSEPPYFNHPRPCDMLPSNLTRIEEVEMENERLREMWMRETGDSVNDDGGLTADGDVEKWLQPFCRAYVRQMPASNSSSSNITHHPSSIYDTISRVFLRVFQAQVLSYASTSGRLRKYERLAGAATASKNGASSVSAEKVEDEHDEEDEKQEEEEKEQDPKATAKASLTLDLDQTVASSHRLPSKTPTASSSAAPLPSPSSRSLRDASTPIISSSSGKIWGGSKLNNFRIRDEEEVEEVLAEAEAQQDSIETGGVMVNKSKDPSSNAVAPTPNNSSLSSSQPFNNFAFAKQKQADAFSNPSSLIKGGIDKKRSGPRRFERKASFLHATRMSPHISDSLVAQKQSLLDASHNIDVQLKQHYEFATRSERAEGVIRDVGRLVAEHLNLLQTVPSSPTLNPSSSPKSMARKSSLVLINLPDAAPAATQQSGATSLPETLTNSNLSISLESKAHQLESLYLIRILRLRELKERILTVLNYQRSMQKTLVRDEQIYIGVDGDATSVSSLPATTVNFTHTTISSTPLIDRSDSWSYDTINTGGSARAHILVKDSVLKVSIVYDAALRDIKELEQELLALASVYIDRHAYVGMKLKGELDSELSAYQSLLNSLDSNLSSPKPVNPTTTATSYSTVQDKVPRRVVDTSKTSPTTEFYPTASSTYLLSSKSAKFADAADRWSILLDLFEREAKFQQAKCELLDVYYEAYTHTVHPKKMKQIAQMMLDLMFAYRPHYDLDRSVHSYIDTYTHEIHFLHSKAKFMREVIYEQVEHEIKRQSVGMSSILSGAGGVSVQSANTGGGAHHASSGGTTYTSLSSTYAMYDWSLFSKEYSNSMFDIENTLSALHVKLGLHGPSGLSSSSIAGSCASDLQREHTLFEVYRSFDIISDVSHAFDAALERVENTLSVPKRNVLNIYRLSIRQRVLDSALHLFRTHQHEDTPFPSSQHSTTLDYLETSPFFTNPSYVTVKLAAHMNVYREGRRVPTVDLNDGNIKEGSDLQVFMNYLELFSVRSDLLDKMYESILLTRFYFNQAEKLGVEAPRTMIDIHGRGHFISNTTNTTTTTASGGASSTASATSTKPAPMFASSPTAATSSYLLSSGTGEVGSFAAHELYGFISKDLFKRILDLERLEVLLDQRMMQGMRSVLEIQTMQVRVLEVTINVHTTLAHMEEISDTTRNSTFDSLPEELKSKFRTKSQATTNAAPQRAGKSPFHPMDSLNTPPGRVKRMIPPSRNTPGSHVNNSNRAHHREVKVRGCFSVDTFIDLYHMKLAAREKMEEYLALPNTSTGGKTEGEEENNNNNKRHSNPQLQLPLTPNPTNASVLSSRELIHSYVHQVFQAFAPEIYVMELSSLLRNHRELHSTQFGACSPFVSTRAENKVFKISGSEGYVEHLMMKQVERPQVVTVAAHRRTKTQSAKKIETDPTVTNEGKSMDSTTLSAPADTTPAPAPATPVVPPSSVSYASIFSLPSSLALLTLLQFDRGALPVPNLRTDALTRKSLYDNALLGMSFAQLEYLPSITVAGTKIAETAASRLDFIRHELQEMSTLNGGAKESLSELLAHIESEREIVWMRILIFVRFLTEALLIRDDAEGLANVSKINRIIRCAGATSYSNNSLLSHPVTPLHRLSSYFLYWCDRRAIASFEGLAREQAAMSKLIYRMGKDTTPVYLAEELPNSSVPTTASALSFTTVPQPPSLVSSSRIRIDRTLTMMRGALQLTQLFDAFYMFAFANEAAVGTSEANVKARLTTPTTYTQAPLLPWVRFPSTVGASLANPSVDMFDKGPLYLRALEVADCNLISKVNEIRRRDGARQKNVFPLALLSILERPSNQIAMLMAQASSSDHQPMALQVKVDLSDSTTGSNTSLTSTTSFHVGELNNSSLFGFTLFALGLRMQDQDLIYTIIQEHYGLELYASCIAESRGKYQQLVAEGTLRTSTHGYVRDSKYSSLLTSTRILMNEIQDTSYEMNVIKEWLATTTATTISDGTSTPIAVSATTSQANPNSVSQRNKPYFVLPKEGFNRQVSQFLRDILVYGESTRDYRISSLEHMNHFYEHLSNDKSQTLASLTGEITKQVEEYTSHTLAQVTDSQYKLIIELQTLREHYNYLQNTHLPKQESLTRTCIESEYENTVHRLSMHIANLHNKLDINNISIRQRILTHYYNLKKSTLEEMIKNGSAPFAIKKRALKILAHEAQFQEMKLEYYGLYSTYLKLHTLYDMKSLLQARMFTKESHQLHTLLSHHESLLSEIGQCESRTTVWQSELQETKNQLIMCHSTLDDLQKSYLHLRRENQKLHAWKSIQLQKLAKLEQITRRFEDTADTSSSISSTADDASVNAPGDQPSTGALPAVDEFDFETFEQDLRSKHEEMTTAQQHSKNAQLRQRLMGVAHEKKLSQLRRLINREDRLIHEANNKIQSLHRSDSSSATSLDPTRDQNAVDRVWEERASIAENKAALLRAENARLRALLGTSEQQQSSGVPAAVSQSPSTRPAKLTPRPPSKSQWKR